MKLDEIDLTDLDRFANGFPHEVFAFLRREAPVWFHPATPRTPGAEGFWVLCRHADITAAAQDSETLSSQSGGDRPGGGMLIEDLPLGFASGVLLNMMDDPRHRRIRRIVTPRVTPSAIQRMQTELRERADAILDTVVPQGRCDFLVDIAAELPLQAISGLLGVPQEDRHKLFRWATATLDYDDRDLGQQSEKTAQAAAEMTAYGTALIQQKRESPGDDLISAVVHAEIENADGTRGPLSDLELQMFFNLLIAAGSETTRNSLALGVAALCENPDEWRKLEADRSLLSSGVEEVLRWASSTPYNRRTATRDTEIAGQPVAAGQKVVLWWASANYDEAVFSDPFRFDVTRDPNPHLAFGHGAHFCLGASLARMEIRIVLDALLDRIALIEIDGPLEWTRSNKHTGIRHMPVRFKAR